MHYQFSNARRTPAPNRTQYLVATVATVARTLHAPIATVKILCEAFRVEFESSAFQCERRLIEQAFSLNHSGKTLVTIIDDASDGDGQSSQAAAVV